MKSVLAVSLCIICISSVVRADIFGSGANQFTIDFVDISGDAGDLGSWAAGSGYTFSGVNHGDYRMGEFEITNDQWNKFANSLHVPVTGNPSYGYDEDPYWTGTNVPTNNVSWYEAAQFVNWLNTSTNHAAAYKFTGTQGTGNYTFVCWEPGDVGYDASNPFRNSNAYYFLPTEDEWVKAAYWNGTGLQTYATVGDSLPVAGVDTNYDQVVGQPWDVGSGVIELNGTFDMMGNVTEWMESPWDPGAYSSACNRVLRGGCFNDNFFHFPAVDSPSRLGYVAYPYAQGWGQGFRVAAVVPEPCSLVMISLGGLVLIRRRR
jgi:formylglycine-generating enzyme required for sulfatase activity